MLIYRRLEVQRCVAAERNPIDVLEIIARVKNIVPDVTLDFYGYASPVEVQKEVEERVKALGLEEVVTFKGYQTDDVLGPALDQAKALLSVSKGEGFGMHILEAMSHGVPVVAYKVKYGVNELVQAGVSGKVVPYAAVDTAVKALVEVLQGNLEQSTYDYAQNFNQAAAWQQWLNTKQMINNIFAKEN
ncbi:lipopolysaccharide biosynthesis protein [Weissella oryzae SG25]|uniref:Lipopolysaccharide biosynthesis protein n=1 Tax=Weissella oryzae (strain DSM 25784 / JCM 18191 / LMG 30913 / SG25) TaxID=1329250 RepID=A0A069CRY8_WEIOS|nr:glycosyltransferase [Weissella oryzae]GAK30565.1 lipopolysaccharide biosynthesis protein [Weissella oryzae SG25]